MHRDGVRNTRIDAEGTKAKQAYLNKAIAEVTFHLDLAPDQATKDALNTQLTQMNADILMPVYLGYVLSGGEGNDRLTGGRGDDWISGDQGADAIKGADGNDILLATPHQIMFEINSKLKVMKN